MSGPGAIGGPFDPYSVEHKPVCSGCGMDWPCLNAAPVRGGAIQTDAGSPAAEPPGEGDEQGLGDQRRAFRLRFERRCWTITGTAQCRLYNGHDGFHEFAAGADDLAARIAMLDRWAADPSPDFRPADRWISVRVAQSIMRGTHPALADAAEQVAPGADGSLQDAGSPAAESVRGEVADVWGCHAHPGWHHHGGFQHLRGPQHDPADHVHAAPAEQATGADEGER